MKRGARFAAVPGRALRDRAMTPKLREVLLSVCYYAQHDGTCVVRISTLAAPTGTDARNMRGYLQRLAELGYITITPRRSPVDGRQLASGYRVLYDTELPDDRDRSATDGTHHVDLDEAVGDDAEQTASDDTGAPGSDYPGGVVLTTPGAPGSDYPATGSNTVSSMNTTPPTPPASAGEVSASDPQLEVNAGGDAQDGGGSSLPGERAPALVAWDAFQQARRELLGDRYRAQQLTAVRRRVIERTIRQRGLEVTLAAVRGWVHDPWVAGENPGGKVYGNAIEFVLRVNAQGDNVERFAELADQAAAGQLPTPKPAGAGGRDAERLARLEALRRMAEGGGGDGPAAIESGAA